MLTSYYNVAEVETACANFATQYPAQAQLLVLPNVTAEGRTSRALRIGRGGAGARPVFMVIGGLHGGEWGSCEIALNLAADLLGALVGRLPLSYGNGVGFTLAQVDALFDHADVVIFPLVNPDGRFYSQQIRNDWRRNRNPRDASPGKPESVGVDLNRNFDFLFDRAQGFAPDAVISTSTQTIEDTYQGPAPFSEAETRNVRWLVQQHPTLRWFVDLHSGAQGVLYPWGDDQLQSTDPRMTFREPAWNGERGRRNDRYGEYMPAGDETVFKALAGAFRTTAARVAGRSYGQSTGFNFMASSGTSHDWLYARHFGPAGGSAPVWSLAVEWNHAVMRPDFPLMAQIAGEVSAGLVAMALAAAVPPQP